jgi:hypothetical protein
MNCSEVAMEVVRYRGDSLCTIVGIVNLEVLRWIERVAYVKETRSIYRMFSWQNFGDATTSKVTEEIG